MDIEEVVREFAGGPLQSLITLVYKPDQSKKEVCDAIDKVIACFRTKLQEAEKRGYNSRRMETNDDVENAYERGLAAPNKEVT